MGMTIEKAIEWYDGLEGNTPQAKDARDVAIETMKKYQKIEQIISDYEEYKWESIDVKDIREIIDGNDD